MIRPGHNGSPRPRNITVSVLALALLSTACAGALHGGTVGRSTPGRVPVYSFGVVACAAKVALLDPCPRPIAGAQISVNSASGYVVRRTDEKGYALFASIMPVTDIKVTAAGYAVGAFDAIEPPKIEGKTISLSLSPGTPEAARRATALLRLHSISAWQPSEGRHPWTFAASPTGPRPPRIVTAWWRS